MILITILLINSISLGKIVAGEKVMFEKNFTSLLAFKGNQRNSGVNGPAHNGSSPEIYQFIQLMKVKHKINSFRLSSF